MGEFISVRNEIRRLKEIVEEFSGEERKMIEDVIKELESIK